MSIEFPAFIDPAVIFEGFPAGGLFIMADKRDVTDLKEERGREVRHIGREMKQRIDQHAFVDDEGIETGSLCFDSAGESNRAGADDDEVVHRMQS